MMSLALLRIEKSDEAKIVDALVKIAKSDKHSMPRAYAAFMLSLFPDNRKAFTAVLDKLNDKHSDVKAFASLSLGLFRRPSSARELRAIIAAKRGSPMANAAYIGLGLLEDSTNANLLVSDFGTVYTPADLEAISFAIARSSDGQTWKSILPYLSMEDAYVREYAVKCLSMMTGLSIEARDAIIAQLLQYKKNFRSRRRKFEEDPVVRFYISVLRYSLGDRSSIGEILDSLYSNEFSLVNTEEMDWLSVFRPINRHFPRNYKIRPIFWSDFD